jgi:hypothetical protein
MSCSTLRRLNVAKCAQVASAWLLTLVLPADFVQISRSCVVEASRSFLNCVIVYDAV